MIITRETCRESYDAVLPKSADRRRIILDILGDRKMTALEIAQELYARGYTPNVERNYAAPRLTELKKAGKEKAMGERYCPETGRNVTLWARIKEAY